jgi:hypothetical protein
MHDITIIIGIATALAAGAMKVLSLAAPPASCWRWASGCCCHRPGPDGAP